MTKNHVNPTETPTEQTDRYTQLMQKASQKVAALQSEVRVLKAAQEEPIAIVGMGCRFPQAPNPQAFWELLQRGSDAIREIPSDRWDVDAFYSADLEDEARMYTRQMGALDQVDHFDPAFFGISPREAEFMDPQQRLLLEVCWEALEDAAIAADQLRHSPTGIFVGMSTNDYTLLDSDGTLDRDHYALLGNMQSVAVGRVAYILGLQGPAIQLDTACSSSLVAIHLACHSLRNGESKLALAGGVNLILAPQMMIRLCRMSALSPTGRCKTFDAAADGYVRGEGCGVVVLKRLSDAVADGDRVLALIPGSAVNHDGPSTRLTAPSEQAQEKLLQQALRNARLTPEAIDYIEAHGTGTSLGDPIEVNTLGTIFGQRSEPLWVGAVKTNIGHLEAAAGIAGLIKLVLSMQHGMIPPHLHYTDPNPYIDWNRSPVRIPTTLTPWPDKADEGQKVAGISSFGFSGTNAHVIVATPPLGNPLGAGRAGEGFKVITLSAKSKPALHELAQRYCNYLDTTPAISLADLAYTTNVGRSHLPHRLSILASSSAALQRDLATYGTTQPSPNVIEGHRAEHQPPLNIAFLFTGQGAQYVGMGRGLYETEPLFRATIERCDEILRQEMDESILPILYPEVDGKGDESQINQTTYTQPALFVIEYALAQLWQSWGIEPNVVMGHSIGEIAAACVADVFSLEDALRLVAVRGRLMGALPQTGAMVACMANEQTVAEAIAAYENRVAIAAVNGPESVVISGERDAVIAVADSLTAQGLKSRELSVSHAFHSPLMEPMLAEFTTVAERITYHQPLLPLVSNLTGTLCAQASVTSRPQSTHSVTNAEYWVSHAREAVRFADGIATLQQQGIDALIEIGPKPILLGMAGEMESADRQPVLKLPSLREGQDDHQQMLRSLGALYSHGATIDWAAVHQGEKRRKVALPTYPFQRQRYWLAAFEQQTPARSNEMTNRNGHQTPVLSMLAQGDVHGLAAQLANGHSLSATEKELLPKLLDLMVAKHHQQQQDALVEDLLYSVKWQPQARFGRSEHADYMPSLDKLVEQLQKQTQALWTTSSWAAYQDALPHLEALSAEYIYQALDESGANFVVGNQFATDTLAKQLGVIRPHWRLLERLLVILSEVGILAAVEGETAARRWEVKSVPTATDPQGRWRQISTEFPVAHAELELLGRCGARLGPVLRGAQDPLELIFPNGDFSAATRLYQESPTAAALNTILCDAMTTALNKAPRRRGIRILEIGAGTGGTTTHLLPVLPAAQVDYTFTDLSPLFLAQAQEKFQEFPFVRYERLDIEADPVAQGFNPNAYDLIVAANVLHATRDLRETLRHVRQLLAPQGLFLLFEATSRQRWVDLIFGLTEGWWRFTDTDLRQDYPLLNQAEWCALLQEEGFANAAAMPTNTTTQQSVLLAQADNTQVAVESVPQSSKRWLLFADGHGVSKALTDMIQREGDEVVWVTAGDTYHVVEPNQITVDPANPADLVQLFNDVNHSIDGIIHCWSLDTDAGELQSKGAIDAATMHGCGSVLHLLQALDQTGQLATTRLWLVTRGAASVATNNGTNQTMGGSFQSLLWGMGKVIDLELPELDCHRIDLGIDLAANAKATDDVEQLWHEISAESVETQVALRGEERYVARLAQGEFASTATAEPFHLHVDATYLITGGLGGLGLQVAGWMAEQGARHLVLVGRSEANAKAKAALQALEAIGVTVAVIQADIADGEQVQGLLTQIADSMPPLRGVIHGAGLLDDGVLLHLNWERFQRVLAPKVAGAWHLHTQTVDLPLDFFVLFSSGAALLGTSGQANHAAANTFLDSLAHLRRAQGLPALSINWGRWSEIGAAAANQHGDRLEQMGITTITPQQGIAAFQRLLQQSNLAEATPQMGVLSVDWERLFAESAELRAQPFLQEIARDFGSMLTAVEGNEQSDTFQATLSAAPVEERLTLLSDHVAQQVAHVLHLPLDEQLDPEQGFFDIGMDSLTSVELKNRLQQSLNCTLPSTLAFNYPTAATLTTYLRQELFSPDFFGSNQESKENNVQFTEPTFEQSTTLGALSKEELAALLAQELGE